MGDGIWRRVATKELELETAKSRALDLYYEATFKGKKDSPKIHVGFQAQSKVSLKDLKARVTQVSGNKLIKFTATPSTNTKSPALDTASQITKNTGTKATWTMLQKSQAEHQHKAHSVINMLHSKTVIQSTKQ